MLKKYVDLLGSLYSNKGAKLDFKTYLEALKYTGALISILLCIVMLAAAVIGLPVYIYRKFVSKYHPQKYINSVTDMEKIDETELNYYQKKFTVRIIIYFCGLMIIYVPFMIPTVLFLLNIMFGI